MIVCSCNVLSDHDVRSAVTAADALPRTARQVYGCLGCSAECGRCARTIKKIIDEALGACAKACCVGLPAQPGARSGRMPKRMSIRRLRSQAAVAPSRGYPVPACGPMAPHGVVLAPI